MITLLSCFVLPVSQTALVGAAVVGGLFVAFVVYFVSRVRSRSPLDSAVSFNLLFASVPLLPALPFLWRFCNCCIFSPPLLFSSFFLFLVTFAAYRFLFYFLACTLMVKVRRDKWQRDRETSFHSFLFAFSLFLSLLLSFLVYYYQY